MSWAFLSLIATICIAAVKLTNQYMQVNGLDLAVVNKAMLAVFSLPFVLIYGLPDTPLFYLFVFLTIPICLYMDAKVFDIAAKYGGGVLTRVEPLYVPLVFIVWLVLSPGLFVEYLQRPLLLFAIISSIAGCVVFSMKMKKCAVSHAALTEMLPILFMMAAVAILNKLAMDYSPLHRGVFAYIFLQSLMMSGAGYGWIVLKQKRTLRSLHMPILIKAAFLVAFATLIHLIAKNYAFSLVADPTFPSIIMLTAPFFVLLFYKLTGHKEKASIWPGLGIVVCALLLTVATSL